MSLPNKFLTADPGEDFGWCLWEDGKFLRHGTNKMWDVADAITVAAMRHIGVSDENPYIATLAFDNELADWFTGIELIISEDWRLYPWAVQAGRLDWDECRTARVIGVMYETCRWTGWEWRTQPAKIKEAAKAAGAEAYFSHPLNENRHQNDATMHGVYALAKEVGLGWADLSDAEYDKEDTVKPH